MSREIEPGSQVYHGIWAVLAGFFKVPRRPPTLVALEGEGIESFRPSPGFLHYIRFQFWLVMLLIGAGALVLWIAALVNEPLVGILLAPLFFVAFVTAGVLGHVALRLRYDTTWYVMSERSVRMRRGIWIIREATITFENVQNVELKQGPLQRHFGVANLMVQTAGGGGAKLQQGQSNPHEGLIEGIGDAKRVRDVIMTRVRRSRRAGLGDERPEERFADTRGAGWTPAHVEALQAIRDEIAGLRRQRGLGAPPPP
jgi:membrane protein YdbS with pleckstrin-like domain